MGARGDKMIAFCADVHIGNFSKFGGADEAGINRRCRLVLDALAEAHSRAVVAKAKAFVVLGDLFDTARPLPQHIRGVQEIFDSHKDRMPVIVLAGNHDMRSDQPGDHALGPLAPVAQIVTKPEWLTIDGVAMLAVPFMPTKEPASEWLPRIVAEHTPAQRAGAVLAIHLGIIDDRTPPWLWDAHDAVHVTLLRKIMQQHGFAYTLAGNWHDRKICGERGRAIVQVGALAATGFDNEGASGYGGLVFLVNKEGPDKVGAHWQEVPGPRFIKATPENLAPKLSDVIPGCRVFVQLQVQPGDTAEASVLLKQYVHDGRIADWEIVYDGADAMVAARSAATAARCASTLGEALDAYVAEMQLDGGLDRADVLATTRGYLR